MRDRIVVSLLLPVVLLSALAGAQVVLTDDAFTWSQTPKTNYGNQIALVVCSGSNSYLKFSFASLPSGLNGTNISGASVVLYADAVLNSGTMDVYAINSSWSEGSITYNNAPALGNKLLSAVSVTKTGYLSLNLTSTVQTWLNGTLANNGIALVPSSGSQISASFDSKENILTGHTGELSLVLVSAGPAGPQGLQGPTGSQGPQGPAGTQGSQGATGATGAAGPQGPQGATGAQGLQGLMGLPGATGATGPQGPAGANGTGFNFRNVFDNSASYAVNDVVTFQGASYVAIAANQGPSNPTPNGNTTVWSVMAAEGATGVAGAQGLQGPIGPTGSPGPQGLPGVQGPAGPIGPVGPVGAQGPAGPGGGINGLKEFTQSGSITAPTGVTHLLVELWGGAGAGGSCTPYTYTYQCNCGTFGCQTCTGTAEAAGGGGGSGGYVRAVVPVVPSNDYSVIVGPEGSSGGGSGSESQILDGSNVLASAPGGAGGGADASGGTGGAGGAAGTSSGPTVTRAGSSGTAGSFDTNNGWVPGAGGTPVQGSVVPIGGAGGAGGGGVNFCSPTKGGPGYVLISY